MKKNAETKAVPQLPTLEELKAELKREKYKARFFNSETTPDDVKDEQEDDVKDDAEEKTYADLFEEREG